MFSYINVKFYFIPYGGYQHIFKQFLNNDFGKLGLELVVSQSLNNIWTEDEFYLKTFSLKSLSQLIYKWTCCNNNQDPKCYASSNARFALDPIPCPRTKLVKLSCLIFDLIT